MDSYEEKAKKHISKDDVKDVFPHGKDLDGDGNVTKAESNIYDFTMKIVEKQNEFYKQAAGDAQRNAKWLSLGSMAFLLLSVVLEILRGSL